MMIGFQILTGINFLASVLVTFAWIGWGLFRGVSVSEVCLGQFGDIGEPAWIDCFLFETLLLIVWLNERKAHGWRTRFGIAALSIWAIFFNSAWNIFAPHGSVAGGIFLTMHVSDYT